MNYPAIFGNLPTEPSGEFAFVCLPAKFQGTVSAIFAYRFTNINLNLVSIGQR